MGGGGGGEELIMPHPLLIVQKQRMSNWVKRVLPPDMMLIMTWQSGAKDTWQKYL